VTIELEELCKTLKLPAIPYLSDQIEFKDKKQYLTEVLAGEVLVRLESKQKRLFKKASFPNLKGLADFNPEEVTFPANVNLETLSTLDFIAKRQNVMMLGSVGTGKTHLAIALGIKACEAGSNVRFYRTVDLVNLLLEKHQAGTLRQLMKEIKTLDLLILDELGFIPFHKNGAELLFSVIAECYELRSVIVTSNLEFGDWNTVFGDNRLTTASIDRLVHHAYILAFTGPSNRLKQALTSRDMELAPRMEGII